jgi:hypothetical protein
VKEQIERALYLKSLIPRNVYPELTALADRCSRILDENIEYLRFLLNQLKLRNAEDVRDVYRSFRVAYRDIETVEYFGIPALHFQTDSSKLLNKLMLTIKNEINLPFVAPSVACFSDEYFWVHGTTNVVFMPIGEANSLLHLPDAFHELGHSALFNRKNDLRLDGIQATYSEIIKKVTTYFENSYEKKKGRTGPPEIPMLIRHLHAQWKNWINEFFPDLFACYTLGPAYAWAHLHLTTKKCDDVFEFQKPPLPQRYPSDDSRMKMLEIGLRKIGFSKEAQAIRAVWDSMPFVTSSTPIFEYQYAYPTYLMEDISMLVLEGMERSEISILSPKILSQLDNNSIRKVLNDAWINFWNNPNYREWEIKTLKALSQS